MRGERETRTERKTEKKKEGTTFAEKWKNEEKTTIGGGGVNNPGHNQSLSDQPSPSPPTPPPFPASTKSICFIINPSDDSDFKD